MIVIRTAPHAAGAPVPVVARAASVPADDMTAKLTQLGELRDAGIVTTEEFTAKKAQVPS